MLRGRLWAGLKICSRDLWQAVLKHGRSGAEATPWCEEEVMAMVVLFATLVHARCGIGTSRQWYVCTV